MSSDVYSTPQSNLEIDSNTTKPDLASRWSRLWASIIDSLIMMLVIVPAMYFTGAFDDLANGVEPSLVYNLAIGLLGFVVFFLINGKFLISDGQTIGKKILGIKIVDLNGNLPGVKQHLLKRYAVYFIPGQVPVVGQIFSVVNILFIFGKEKRCLHDMVAGTKVVNR